jgi:hypothetical protein
MPTTRPTATPSRPQRRRATSQAPSASVAAGKTAPAVAASPVKPGRKNDKPRPRLVRDSFTMPEADFALIPALKERALKAQRATKKSELLRAGLHALAALDDKAFMAALGRLEPVQTGRPKKSR